MYVCMVSRWNASCGVSLHAELVGRELVRRGFRVTVFAPTVESACRDWHHRVLGDRDEDWVYQCYEESDDWCGWLDEELTLSTPCDILLVEAYNRLPYKGLREVIWRLKRRGVRTVAVVHGSTRWEVEPVVSLDFDAIVVFDYRFISELLSPYLHVIGNRVHVIPYPCVEPLSVEPWRPDFAEGKILFFTFGRQPVGEYRDFLIALKRLSRRYDLVYWIIRCDGLIPGLGEPWIVQWFRRLSLRELYSYLGGADIHLLPKGRTWRVVVSSTVYQTLGALTPIVTPDTRYVETLPSSVDGVGPIVKYRSIGDLEAKITRLIEDEEFRGRVVAEAKRYVRRYNVANIVSEYIRLFNKLVGGEVETITRLQPILVHTP